MPLSNWKSLETTHTFNNTHNLQTDHYYIWSPSGHMPCWFAVIKFELFLCRFLLVFYIIFPHLMKIWNEILFKTFNGEECWKRPSKNQTQKRRDKESGKNTVKRHVNCCIFVVTVNRENRPHFTKKEHILLNGLRHKHLNGYF